MPCLRLRVQGWSCGARDWGGVTCLFCGPNGCGGVGIRDGLGLEGVRHGVRISLPSRIKREARPRTACQCQCQCQWRDWRSHAEGSRRNSASSFAIRLLRVLRLPRFLATGRRRRRTIIRASRLLPSFFGLLAFVLCCRYPDVEARPTVGP